MYSQYNEEEYILYYYKGFKGKFLDIGAHNGIDLSNTRALAELGWSGVCVEPNPTVFSNLLKLYEQIHSVSVVNCAVDIESELKMFSDNYDGYVSTLNKDHQDFFVKNHGSCYREMYLKTIKIEELFECFGFDFNFLSIDVEGMDLEILKTVPFEKLSKLSLLCVEHGHNPSTVLDALNKYNFKPLVETKGNLILERIECQT